MIVPDGILFRRESAYRHIREQLLTDFTVKAVIRLPAGIFLNAPGVHTSIMAFEHGPPRTGIIRYYEVPPLPKRTGRTPSALPADVLDEALAWTIDGKPGRYSWEVHLDDVTRGDFSIDLRWPGLGTNGALAQERGEQMELFAGNDFACETSERLGSWIEERGERAETLGPRHLLGVSKHGLTSFRRMTPANTLRYRRVEAGDLVYNPMRAELGSIALCSAIAEEGWVSPDYIVFRLTPGAPFGAEYLLRFLRSAMGRQETRRLSHGSVRRRLRYEDLEQIEVPCPAADSDSSCTQS